MNPWTGSRRLLAALLLAIALPAVAAPITRQARTNDVATSYTLHDNGVLIRRVGTRNCTVTTNVLDFKVSQHPNDVAVVYYIKDENTPNLFALNNSSRIGGCPETRAARIMEDVARIRSQWKYHVVSNTHTTIVNVAMNRRGDFRAWDDRVVVLSARNVVNYVMNPGYGVAGRPFSTYVAFLLNDDGHVLKVRGQTPATSTWDTSRTFPSLDSFRQHHSIP